MKAVISPSRAYGRINAPPSKSMSHRLLLCAGLAEGESKIYGISKSEDISATIDCLGALGAQVELDEASNTAHVFGIDIKHAEPHGALYCRESGSTLRFFLPPALLTGKAVTLSGAPSLMRRPMEVYRDFCTSNNLMYVAADTSITVRGIPSAGKYTVPGNISSQFISGFLFALPLLDGDSTITVTPPIESRSYISLTIAALAEFGIKIEWKNEKTLFIPGGQRYIPCECTVEGDYSNAAFLDAFNLIGGDVQLDGLREDSLQGDRVYSRYYDLMRIGSPALHIGDCPDLGPILFSLAAAKFGGVFSGTRRLKIKESDRAAAMAEELTKLGARVRVEEDSVTVYAKKLHKPECELASHNDHRIVMALAVLLSLTGGVIDGAEAVAKSYPSFFDDIAKLGIEVKLI